MHLSLDFIPGINLLITHVVYTHVHTAGSTEEVAKLREKEETRKQVDESNIKALLKTMSSAPAHTAKSTLSSAIGGRIIALAKFWLDKI